MSVATPQAFLALDRSSMQALLLKALGDMNDLTMKNAVFLVLSTYKPSMLQELTDKPAEPPVAKPPVAKPPFVPSDEMRTVTDKNINWLMKKCGLDYEEAWKMLRCYELEDGASICCSEECEEHDSADIDLVMAAAAGEEKRHARRASL